MENVTTAHSDLTDLASPQHGLSNSLVKTRPSLLAASSFSTDEISIELKGGSRSYTNLDLVAGTIVHSPLVDLTDASLSVQLMGISHVGMDIWDQSRGTYRSKTSEWVFLRSVVLLKTDRAAGSVAFAFELPNTLQPGQCPLHQLEHLALPPSLGIIRPDHAYDMTPFDARVTTAYQIRAEVRSRLDGTLIGYASRRINVVPRIGASRPSTPDYSRKLMVNKYQKSVTSRLGKAFGDLVLSIDQEAMLFTNATRDHITSPLRLLLEFGGPVPPSITKVKIILIARTARRTSHSHTADDDTGVAIERDVQSIRFGYDGFSNWSYGDAEPLNWRADLCLPVTLLDDPNVIVIPSFESCLLARRYEIRLILSLASPLSGLLGLSTVEYQFPITITTPPSRGSPVVEFSSLEDDKVIDVGRPTYWEVCSTSVEVAPISDLPHYIDAIPDLELDRRPSWQEKDGRGRSQQPSPPEG